MSKRKSKSQRGSTADFAYGEFPFLDGVPSADAEKVKVLQAELRRIGEALDDPRVDLTMTMSEVILEMKQKLAERDTELGTGDFTIEFFTPLLRSVGAKTGTDFRNLIDDVAPKDGEWHNVGISRVGDATSTYGDEYLGGVMFCFRKVYDKDGKMREAHYTRADLVRG